MNKKQQEWAESHIGLVFTIKGQRREVISYQGGEADLILQFKDGHTYTKRWPKWSYEENPPKKPVQFNSEQIAHIYDTMQQFIRQPPSAFEDPDVATHDFLLLLRLQFIQGPKSAARGAPFLENDPEEPCRQVDTPEELIAGGFTEAANAPL